ncbi:MAG TPA: Arc family DNA binding domain-containing protein [Phycisphaerae bacterium]|nr:Arc family DNA binding domain-containing protein [Phycisphaerae bacterium]HQL53365.1 Arc family DNA binding domain-containing protein [Phycisphaerae bacterium]
MADTKKAILLRIPADLSDALQRWARDELRSVNAQIEYVLREAVRKRGVGRNNAPPAEVHDDRRP